MKTQGAALKAQAEQAQLAEKVRELEEQLAAIARWETVVQHYKLRALVPDVFVYEYVAPTWDSEPSHFACANCFQLRVRSILHKPRQHMRYLSGYFRGLCRSSVSSDISMVVHSYVEALHFGFGAYLLVKVKLNAHSHLNSPPMQRMS